MEIKSVSLLNYKNLEQVELSLSSKVNCFVGDNGAGKTNLLDAVYYLSFCKSFFSASDALNIQHDQDFMMIQGTYIRDKKEEEVSCGVKRDQKKQFKRSGKVYKRLSDHIGLFPLVMVSPSDSNLILGASEERRKFIDGVISQYDKSYLHHLMRYKRAIDQRNNLLKSYMKTDQFDPDMIEVFDDQLIEHGTVVFEKRESFIGKLIPIFQHFYQFVSMGNEKVSIGYHSELKTLSMKEILRKNASADRVTGRTNGGIHKDDLMMMLGDHQIRKTGSQGQKKTYLTALKLAQFDFIKEASSIKPLLLLDDIFDKLDSKRVSRILELVSENHFGQIFITDTNREHLDAIVEQIKSEFKIYHVENGKILEQ